MKMKLRSGLLGLAMVAVAALALSSCSGFWIALGFISSTGISGTIVDARNVGTSFSGAVVTLTNTETGKVYHPTVQSDNTWNEAAPDSGTYTISVSEGSYNFFTSSTAPFSYNGSAVTAPTIAGLYTPYLYQSSSGTSYITFILTWNNTNQLNLIFSGPDGNTVAANAPTVGTSIDFTDPSYDLSYNTLTTEFVNAWNNGFGPNGSISSSTGNLNPNGRVFIDTSSTSFAGATTNPGMILNTTATNGYGPDAITLRDYLPVPTTATPSGSFAVSPNTYNTLPSSGWWEGVGIFYIDAPASGDYISTGGSSATSTNATLWAVGANSDGTPDVLGVYTVPTNTNIDTIAALRMNIFNFGYQLVPLMQTVNPGDIRSMASKSGVVFVPRPNAK